MAAESPKPAVPPQDNQYQVPQPHFQYSGTPFPHPAIATPYPPFFPYPPPDPNDPNAVAAVAAAPQFVMFPPPGMVYAFPPPGQVAFAPAVASQPASAATSASSDAKPKRRQVKMACTNCAQACKRCDDVRPCERCLKYGIADSCVDGQRKERKKGIKRGPYKRKTKPTPEVFDFAPESEWQPPPAPSVATTTAAIQAVAQLATPDGLFYYPPPPGYVPPLPDGQPTGDPTAQPQLSALPYYYPGFPPYLPFGALSGMPPPPPPPPPPPQQTAMDPQPTDAKPDEPVAPTETSVSVTNGVSEVVAVTDEASPPKKRTRTKSKKAKAAEAQQREEESFKAEAA